MNQQTRAELDELITAVLEQDISVEQKELLENLLREDWECRRHYLESLDLHAALLHTPALTSGRLHVPRISRQLVPRWLPAAAAAILFLTGGAAFLLGKHGGTSRALAEQTENGCAMLAQVYGDGKLSAGAILKPGPLHLQSGLARIEFFSGATVLLEGEAELDIKSAWAATCRMGRARVSVPPPAEGFRLNAPGMELIDVGTEFGVSVDAAGVAELHVFDGKVEAHPDGEPMRLVVGGESLRSGGGSLLAGVARPVAFTSADQMDARVNERAQARFQAWLQWSQQMRTDSRLIACYDFKHGEGDRWDRIVSNVADSQDKARTGAAVGARWTQGRWPMKDALQFKGPGDRVRIPLGKTNYEAITLACWVCVEALDRKYNALLLTDGYDAGEPHWQIYEDGRLMFSIAYPDPSKPEGSPKKLNQIYYSPSVFNLTNQRRWHHVAVSYDNQSGESAQYFDGKEISREVSPYHRAGRPITFGPAELGNWGLPTEGHHFPIRNLNGRMDEFAIYRAALGAAEIAQIYEAAKPE